VVTHFSSPLSFKIKSDAIRDLHQKALEITRFPERFKELLLESIGVVKAPTERLSLVSDAIVELRGEGKYVFIGDLHGDYYALLTILNALWDEQESSMFIFLGDYVDRGYMQVETLSLVLLLKNKFPDRVVLLRGNHEPPSWLKPYPHDYPITLRSKYGSLSKELYDRSLELFDALPLVAIKKGLFLALHGGPPLKVLKTNYWVEAFTWINEDEKHEIVEQVLWSDPSDLIDTYTHSPRGAGILYGKSVSERALSLIEGRMIVRGHEPVMGVEESHGGLVVTVFSSPLVYELRCAGVLVLQPSPGGRYEVKRGCVEPWSGAMLTLNKRF
jgi:protein phosphatase